MSRALFRKSMEPVLAGKTLPALWHHRAFSSKCSWCNMNFVYKIKRHLKIWMDSFSPKSTWGHRTNIYSGISTNWMERGAVLPVRDQLLCYSCWAFAVTAVCSNAYYILHGKLLFLANQELLDNVKWRPGVGGYIEDAYEYITYNGICLEQEYPYEGERGKPRHERKTKALFIDWFVRILPADEAKMVEALQRQPILAKIAINKSFIEYEGGIYGQPPSVAVESIVGYHYVVIVDCQCIDGVDVWHIQNSWGPTWGMGGYMYMERNYGPAGVLAINLWPTYPLISREYGLFNEKYGSFNFGGYKAINPSPSTDDNDYIDSDFSSNEYEQQLNDCKKNGNVVKNDGLTVESVQDIHISSSQTQPEDIERKARVDAIWQQMNRGVSRKTINSISSKPSSTVNRTSQKSSSQKTSTGWMTYLGLASKKTASVGQDVPEKKPSIAQNGSSDEAKKLAAAALSAIEDASALAATSGRGKVILALITEVRDFAGEEIEFERVNFLQRTDYREFERERDAWLAVQAKRKPDMREDP